MKEGRLLPMVSAPAAPAAVSRRAALQSLAVGLGAGLAAPMVADGHPVQQHFAHAASAQAPAADPTSFTPTFFDAHQLATVRILAELIVPGAQASGTPEFLDKLLDVETAESRRRFITALGAMDGAALRAHKQPFKDLSESEQTALLTQVSTLEPSRTPTYWTKGAPIPVLQPPPAPLNVRDHFDHIKGWVAGIHFASESGLKELGWTGMMFFETFNGCAT